MVSHLIFLDNVNDNHSVIVTIQTRCDITVAELHIQNPPNSPDSVFTKAVSWEGRLGYEATQYPTDEEG